ncbi:hypothetical protein ACO22_01489 [Paracoccidioides brasiliensis]|uniref:Uncharacterized protein n=1 Tax=Paracoccidioides brasiliensis TaxID=121759 RepID=A0A1D2JLB7_PARBR|nr:hypothetical protein ACO22_01489 [Paracoccidioides brasiliensis]
MPGALQRCQKFENIQHQQMLATRSKMDTIELHAWFQQSGFVVTTLQHITLGLQYAMVTLDIAEAKDFTRDIEETSEPPCKR